MEKFAVGDRVRWWTQMGGPITVGTVVALPGELIAGHRFNESGFRCRSVTVKWDCLPGARDDHEQHMRKLTVLDLIVEAVEN